MFFTKPSASAGLAVGLSLVNAVAAGGTNYIFTFGDSYTTTGFNASGNKPSPFNALGNPDYPGQTTAGTGLGNWVDKLTYDHNPSGYYTFTYNYAVGSACVNDTRYYTARVPSFIGQTGNFAFTRPDFTSDQAVAIPYWGTNDIFLHSTQLNTTDNGVISDTMNDYFSEVEVLYNVGVRYFVFLSADPVERTPRVLGTDIAQRIYENRVEWNKQLNFRINYFSNTHPSAKVFGLDLVSVFNQVLDNPVAYGAPNNTCTNYDGKSCLWWDGFHPGQKIHQAISDNIAIALHIMGFSAY